MVSDHKRIDGFLQGARSLQLLGLEHILLLSLTQRECKLIRDVIPEVGCGWTTFESPKDLEGVYSLWNMRYRIVARLAFLHKCIHMHGATVKVAWLLTGSPPCVSTRPTSLLNYNAR